MRLSDRKDIVKLKKILFVSTIALLTVVGIFLIVYLKRSKGVYYEEDAFVMGTRVRVVVASEKFSSKSLADNVISEFRRIDAKFDPYREGSVLYKLNHSNGWVKVDEETFNLVDSAIRYCKATEGAFDPTLGRVIKLWGFDKLSEKTGFRVPNDEDIRKALEKSGCDKVKLDEKDQKVMLDGVWLDLGGIVKGYALERSYAIVKGLDPKATGFIDAGGEIRVIGPKYGYAPWTIGIRNPRGSDAMDFIYLKSGAVATSGDYERYFIKDGVRYHHIIDPKTGKPARGARSVTVITDDAVLADVYSTAGFVMAKDWRYVVVHFPEIGIQVMMVLDDGTVVKSDGFEYYEVRR
jgi:thiamine biosynthesis lipoprotein